MAAQRRYSNPARTLHWAVAALILFQVPWAYYMMDLPLGPAKLQDYALHKSVGMTIFALSCVRLAWRWLFPPPPPPATMSPLQCRLAGLTHAWLYLVTFAMPLTGWLGSSAANFPVSLFGWLTLPDLVAPDEDLHERLKLAHELLAYTLFTAFTLHVLAAMYHQFIARDGVLAAMLPGLPDRECE